MMPDPEDLAATNGRDAAGWRYLFVYGTLRAGGSNDITHCSPAPRLISAGAVRGALHDFGGWPGLLLDERAGPVIGEVYQIDPALEPLLDQLESVQADDDGDYRRRTTLVAVADRTLACLVYEIQPRLAAGRPLVAGGDWIARAVRPAEPG